MRLLFTASEVLNLIEQEKESVLLLDIRQPFEYSSEHIVGARLFPLSRLLFEAFTPAVPTDQLIIVYCASGHRSILASKLLERQGYTNVAQLQGGFAHWTGPKERSNRL